MTQLVSGLITSTSPKVPLACIGIRPNAPGKWHPVSHQPLAASEDLRPPLVLAGVAGVTMFAREFEMTRALTRRSNDRGPSDEQLSRTPKRIRETTPDAVETMPPLAGPR